VSSVSIWQKPMWLSQPSDFCFFCQSVAFAQPPDFLFEAKLAIGFLSVAKNFSPYF
jgi:hypothetical protein